MSQTVKLTISAGILFLSCFNFEFESEYEDINGIYLEQIACYDIHGEKIVVKDNLGYIINGDTLLIYNLENVDSIFLLNSYDAISYIHDFAIDGDYIYLAEDFGMEIIEVGGTYPNMLGQLHCPSTVEISVMNNRAYLIPGDYRSRIDIVDITDKANPVLIDSIVFEEAIWNIAVDSNHAYVHGYQNFLVIDIRQSNFPIYSISIDTMYIRSFTLDGPYLHFSVLSGVPKLVTFTLSSTYSLNHISEIDCPMFLRPLKIDESYGLGPPDWSHLYLLDMTDHSRPYLTEYIDVWASATLADLHDNYIYLLSPLCIIEIKQVEQ